MVIGSIISWLIFSILVGVIGLNRKIGFWGAFSISLLLSPIIGLIFALVSKSLSEEKYENEVMTLQQKQNKLLSNIDKGSASSITDDLIKMNELYEKGVVDKEEFGKIKAKLISNLNSDDTEHFTEDQTVEDYTLYRTNQGEIFIRQQNDKINIGDLVYNYFKRPFTSGKLRIKGGPIITIENGSITMVE